MTLKTDIQIIKTVILAILMCYFVLWLAYHFGEFSFFAFSVILLVFIFGLLIRLEARLSSVQNLIFMLLSQGGTGQRDKGSSKRLSVARAWVQRKEE